MKCCTCGHFDATNRIQKGNVVFLLCPVCFTRYKAIPEHVESQTS